VAHELFEIQIKTSLKHSLQLIDILLDQDPTRGRDSMIHKHVRLIRELVALNDADERKQVEFAAYTTLPDQLP
jgi:hypothetical protein